MPSNTLVIGRLANSRPVLGAPHLQQWIIDFYQQVLRLLNQHRVPYTVGGAFALRQHTGICRITKDLDLFMTAKDMTRTVELFQEDGFECEVPDAVWLAKIKHGDAFIDLITGMSNAVFAVNEEWIARAHPATVLGVETTVLAPEELLIAKLFVSRRDRFDGADIAHIVYVCHETLDWAHILRMVGEHWEMLLWALILYRYSYPDQSARVPLDVWDLLLNRLREAILDPSPEPAFRGTLVDETMFAIDVEQWGLADLVTTYRARRLKEIES